MQASAPVDEDIRLVRKTLAGDQGAFRLLVERHQDFVFSLALRVLRSREEAEEVAQDVFVKIYRTLHTFEERSGFRTWMYTVTYRAAIDKVRLLKMPQTSLDDERSVLQIAERPDSGPMSQSFQSDLRTQLQLALKRMKPEDAMLLELFYLHEQSVKDIVDITGLSLSNVKTKLHRLRETLKEELLHLLKEEVWDLLE
ncbi:MAG: sigma-70 family RNA polymerase sigma factor [Saprospiraceae bacterium]|nr:sigma-70 family RNA polymerase sigma factor [Saprospiraceae bacterium]